MVRIAFVGKGGSRLERRLSEAARGVLDEGSYRIATTRRAGEARALARMAAEQGAEIVAAVGGDGTINEVANGLLDRGGEPPALAIVPYGSGNDLARAFRFDKDLTTSCRRIAMGRTYRIDAARVVAIAGPVVDRAATGRCFVNSAGIGFTAAVAHYAARIQGIRGMPRYLIALARVLATRHITPDASVTIDRENFAMPISLVEMCNGPYEGGGFWTAPGASLDDGKLDVILAAGMSRAAMVGLVPFAIRGTHFGRPRVTARRATRVRVEVEEPLAVQADGEILGRANVLEVEVLPAALRVLR